MDEPNMPNICFAFCWCVLAKHFTSVSAVSGDLYSTSTMKCNKIEKKYSFVFFIHFPFFRSFYTVWGEAIFIACVSYGKFVIILQDIKVAL